MSWIDCVVDNDYQIFTEYPYQIRRKSNHRIIKESAMSNGYIQCYLNAKHYLKHRIVAQQFVSNPENLPEVDHVNHNRADNRISNIRWCSRSINLKNKSSHKGVEYEFYDEIPTDEPNDIIEVVEYGEHRFNNLFYCNGHFYHDNGETYRKLHFNNDRGNIFVCVKDTNSVNAKISINKFKNIYGLD